MNSPPTDARQWSTFPIDANPRPLILLEPRTRVHSGFVDGKAKLAWSEGRVVVTVSVPQEVQALLPERRDFGGPDTARVELDAAKRTTAAFRTDRGPRELPAWQLTGPQLLGPCTVLNPDVPVWWPPPGHETDPQFWFGDAWIDPDGTTMHLPAAGGFGTEFIRAEFTEHPTYVVGHPVTRQKFAGDQVVPLVLLTDHVIGRLANPLGDRVLVDDHGHPIPVTPPPSPTSRGHGALTG